MCAHSSKEPFWRSPRAPPSPRQVSKLVPATGSASAPAPTGGECDTVNKQWACTTCTLLNDANASKCLACCAPSGERDIVVKEWACTTCTLLNGANESQCKACGADAPASALALMRKKVLSQESCWPTILPNASGYHAPTPQRRKRKKKRNRNHNRTKVQCCCCRSH